jgi:RecA/RadA recombinase
MARPAKKKVQDTPTLTTVDDIIDQDTPAPVKKRTTFRSAVKNTTFDIFSEEASMQRTKDLMAKVGRGTGFTNATNTSRGFLPVPWLGMQYLIGRPGIPVNTVVEFIGAEGVGKSSLTFALMGSFVANNIPCYYVNSEPKALEPDWQLRLLGSDEVKAKRIRDIINVQSLNSFEEMDEHMRAWVNIKRDEEKIPIDVPLVMIVDSVSKLMNPEEFSVSGLAKPKAGEKAVEGLGSLSKKPGVSARWLHDWGRQLSGYLEAKNLTLIVVSAQNQNMDAAGAYIKPAEKNNDTCVGGYAMRQIASLRFTVTYKGAVKNSRQESVGKEVLLYCKKNSYGPSFREIKYQLLDDRQENYKTDVPGTYVGQAIDMDAGLAAVMADRRILGTTVNKKRYSSTKLNAYELSAQEFIEHIANDPDMFKQLTDALSIKGYEYDEEENA